MQSQPLYGHNGMQYTLDTGWADLNKSIYPVNDCHEMVQDKKGRIIIAENLRHSFMWVFDPSKMTK